MCKYCRGDDSAGAIANKYIKVLNSDIFIELWINGNLLTLGSGEYCKPIFRKRIKYCPMCGRKQVLQRTNF